MRRSTFFIAAVLLASPAIADTAYVKPSSFAPTINKTITVEVSFSDYCCEPRYAVRTDTFRIIRPDGTEARPDRQETFATTTMLEQKIIDSNSSRIRFKLPPSESFVASMISLRFNPFHLLANAFIILM